MPASEHFLLLDWIVLIVYLVGITLLGVWFSKRQTSTKEFFVAGKRMHWLPVSLSVVATLFSAISFIGHAARVYRYDMSMFAYGLGVIVVTPIICYVLLPFYCRLNVTTAYEYLEKRFGLNVRLLASALFILKRVFWMSLVVLAPSLALSAVTGLRVEYCILMIGVLATLYTTLGGMSAVIWTDVVQFVILMAGQILIIVYVAGSLDGGWAEMWRVGVEDGKIGWSWEWNWSDTTFWTVLIAGAVLALGDLGADQVTVQRLISTRNESFARKSLWFNAVWKLPGMVILLGMGVALWAFYKARPDQLGLDAKQYDMIVPYFVVTQLPAGISGLVIAALFAAAMSSFDSGLNCLVAAYTCDWHERLIARNRPDSEYLKLAKYLTLGLGIVVTAAAILIYLTGIQSIIDASNKYLGFFGGGLLGIFLLGMITRRAKPWPTVIGTLIGVTVVLAIDLTRGYMGAWAPHTLWYGTIACGITMLIGYFGSLVGRQIPEYTLVGLTLATKEKPE